MEKKTKQSAHWFHNAEFIVEMQVVLKSLQSAKKTNSY